MKTTDRFLVDMARRSWSTAPDTAKTYARIEGEGWAKDAQARMDENPFHQERELELGAAWETGFRNTRNGVTQPTAPRISAAERSLPPGDRD